MRYALLVLIEIYQRFISEILKNLFGINASCRFSPTCSNYAKEAIAKYGAARGSFISIQRILRCQPFYNINHLEKSYI